MNEKEKDARLQETAVKAVYPVNKRCKATFLIERVNYEGSPSPFYRPHLTPT